MKEFGTVFLKMEKDQFGINTLLLLENQLVKFSETISKILNALIKNVLWKFARIYTRENCSYS